MARGAGLLTGLPDVRRIETQERQLFEELGGQLFRLRAQEAARYQCGACGAQVTSKNLVSHVGKNHPDGSYQAAPAG